MPQHRRRPVRKLRAIHSGLETRMFYTALCLSLFGAAYAFLVSLTIF